jgi:hypothetical protein
VLPAAGVQVYIAVSPAHTVVLFADIVGVLTNGALTVIIRKLDVSGLFGIPGILEVIIHLTVSLLTKAVVENVGEFVPTLVLFIFH